MFQVIQWENVVYSAKMCFSDTSMSSVAVVMNKSQTKYSIRRTIDVGPIQLNELAFRVPNVKENCELEESQSQYRCFQFYVHMFCDIWI